MTFNEIAPIMGHLNIIQESLDYIRENSEETDILEDIDNLQENINVLKSADIDDDSANNITDFVETHTRRIQLLSEDILLESIYEPEQSEGDTYSNPEEVLQG